MFSLNDYWIERILTITLCVKIRDLGLTMKDCVEELNPRVTDLGTDLVLFFWSKVGFSIKKGLSPRTGPRRQPERTTSRGETKAAPTEQTETSH